MCNLISKFVLFAMLIMVTQPTFAQLYEVPLDQRIDQSEVIVEGEVISSKAFRGSDDNIYTSHRVAVSKVLTANQVPATVEIITFGGELDDELQTWTHLLTLNQGDKGVFFLNAAKPKDAYFRSAVTAYDVYASSQGFVQYRTNEAQALVAVEPFKQYNDIKQEIFARIEQKKGHKATLPESASVAMFRTGIRFHFKNIAFDGLKVKFDLYVNSLVGNKVLNSAGIQLSYNPVFFGPSVVNNGGLSVFENGISLDYGYDFSAVDVSSTTTKISLLPNPALGGKVEIGANEQLLGRGEFVIQNPLVDPGITYNIEQSKAFNTYIEESVNKQFDTVVVVGSWRESCLTITDFMPKVLNAGTFDTLTIKGTCFGVTRGSGKVEFRNSKQGKLLPVDLVEPTDSCYILWTDSIIRVIVPSFVKSADIASSAGTGLFRVTNMTGTSVDSKDTLKVRFAALNDHTGIFNTPPDKDVKLITNNINSKGGVSIYYNSVFKADTNAVKAFERALISWRCATLINYVIEDSSAISSLTNTGKVSFKPLPVGTLTTLAGTNNLPYAICLPVVEASLRRRFEISFNSSLLWHTLPSMPLSLPVSTYDLESRAVHELGHAHLLNHSNNVEDLMYWTDSLPPYNYRRSIMPNDLLGGLHIVNISTIPLSNPSPVCSNPMVRISFSECMKTSKLEEVDSITSFSISVDPNPVNDILRLEIPRMSNAEKVEQVLILDLSGRIRYSSDVIEESILVTSLEDGAYFIALVTSNGKFAVTQFQKY
jgi:hypothetical protein